MNVDKVRAALSIPHYAKGVSLIFCPVTSVVLAASKELVL